MACHLTALSFSRHAPASSSWTSASLKWSKIPFPGVSPEWAHCEAVPGVAEDPDDNWWARHHLPGQEVPH